MSSVPGVDRRQVGVAGVASRWRCQNPGDRPTARYRRVCLGRAARDGAGRARGTGGLVDWCSGRDGCDRSTRASLITAVDTARIRTHLTEGRVVVVPDSRASTSTVTCSPSAEAVRIPPRWRSRHRSTPRLARSTAMWTASTAPEDADGRVRGIEGGRHRNSPSASALSWQTTESGARGLPRLAIRRCCVAGESTTAAPSPPAVVLLRRTGRVSRCGSWPSRRMLPRSSLY